MDIWLWPAKKSEPKNKKDHHSEEVEENYTNYVECQLESIWKLSNPTQNSIASIQ